MAKDRSLPPVRVDEDLLLALYEDAADRDMKISEHIRSILEADAFGRTQRGRSVADERSACQPSTAMQERMRKVS